MGIKGLTCLSKEAELALLVDDGSGDSRPVLGSTQVVTLATWLMKKSLPCFVVFFAQLGGRGSSNVGSWADAVEVSWSVQGSSSSTVGALGEMGTSC